MKKFMVKTKRFLAIALTAAMMIGETTTSLAATVKQNTTTKESTEELSAKALEKAPAKAPAKANNNLLNALDKPLDNPGKVTGVCVKNTNSNVNNPEIYWNALTAADGYEIRLCNETEEYAYGQGYVPYYDGISGKYSKEPNYLSTSSNHISVYNGTLYAIKLGTVDAVMVGGKAKEISNGTYKLQVRAYNKKNIDSKYYCTFGAWSDPINFTYNKSMSNPINITGLKYSLLNNGKYAFSIPYVNGSVQFEIKDSEGYFYSNRIYSDGSPAYLEYGSADIYIDEDGKMSRGGYYLDSMASRIYRFKLVNNKYQYVDDKTIEPGKKYTVRCRNYIGTGLDANKYGAWSNAVTFTVSKTNTTLSKTGNIYLSGNYLYWNEVPGAQSYELQVTNTTTGFTFPVFTSSTNKFYLYNGKYDGKVMNDRGNYTVKIRACCKNDNNENVYGDWAVGSYCYEQPVTSLPKVEGVSVSDDGDLEWNDIYLDSSLVVSYEYEIKDTAGRVYTKDYGTIPSTAGTSISSYNTKSLYSFKLVDGEYVKEKDPLTGNNLYAFANGRTYYVRVRANVVTGGKTVYGAWSDVCTKTMPAYTITGYNWKPGKVTGVWVQTESTIDSKIEYPTLKWNYMRDVSCYQIEIVDSKGNVYTGTPEFAGNSYVVRYLETGNYYYALKTNMASTYSINGSAYTKKTDASGKVLNCMKSGETYKLRVRAVNRYSVSNGVDGTTTQTNFYYGDWSDYVTYTQGAISTSISNFRYVKKSDNDNYLFAYDTTADKHNIYYQVATDKNFNSASVVVDWTSAYDSSYDLCIPENTKFKNNTTYYVRIAYSSDRLSSSMDANEYKRICASALVTSFKDTKNNSVKAITGFRLARTQNNQYEFMFDTKIDIDIEHYEIQVATDKNTTNWKTIKTDSEYVSFGDLSRTVLYFRAISYKKIEDGNGISKKIYGKASNIVTIDHRLNITSPVGKLSYMGETKDNYVFSYSGKIKNSEILYVEIANTKNFAKNDKKNNHNFVYTTSNSDGVIELSKSSFHPNQTYYFRAYVSNSNTTDLSKKSSPYTNTVKIKTKFIGFKCSIDKVTENSISMFCSYNFNRISLTGYEFQRKQTKGKKSKWVTVSKSTTSYYTDKKLKANKKYSYRVRAYYFDDATKKTTYSKWVTLDATTGWSDQLILKVGARTNKMVKLTWNKIKGAKGYEIYKMVSHSQTSEIKNGFGDSYEAYQLVKTLGKKATSYKDKNISSDNEYKYIVRAYKKVKGKKVYIDGNVKVSAEPTFTIVKSYNNSKGQLVVNWQPIVGAKKYVIKKYNIVTNSYETIKTIKKGSTTTYKFPAAKSAKYEDSYKVFVYLKNKGVIISQAIYNSYKLKAPTNVKAKVVKNGIKISWKKVKGADFYRVYRTTCPYFSYNKDLKGYNCYGASTSIPMYVADSTKISGYKALADYESNVTSIVDRKVSYTVNGTKYIENWGPLTGVKYYYYVVAYKYEDSTLSNDHNYSYEQSLGSKLVSAKIKGSKPAKTKIKKATSKKKNITLKYKKIAKADGYEIARSAKSKKKGFKIIKTVSGAKKVTFKDKSSKKNKLKKGKYYYYKIRSYKYDEVGNKIFSKYSAVKKVKCK